MHHHKMPPLIALIALVLVPFIALGQHTDAFKPDTSAPQTIPGYTLIWHDEFNNTGRPDPASWTYEKGFVRNKELQWYQPANASCKNGVLLIEGRKEKITNPGYIAGSTDWRHNRPYAEYTSACIQR